MNTREQRPYSTKEVTGMMQLYIIRSETSRRKVGHITWIIVGIKLDNVGKRTQSRLH